MPWPIEMHCFKKKNKNKPWVINFQKRLLSSCIDYCSSIVLLMNNLLKLGKWHTASHNVEAVFLRWWPLSCLPWSRHKVRSFQCFIDEFLISLDDNDDDDVDDDLDYEKVTSPLIHNLSIVFLSKLRTIEMYIKNQRTFKNYLGQYLLGDSLYQRNRLMLDFWRVFRLHEPLTKF